MHTGSITENLQTRQVEIPKTNPFHIEPHPPPLPFIDDYDPDYENPIRINNNIELTKYQWRSELKSWPGWEHSTSYETSVLTWNVTILEYMTKYLHIPKQVQGMHNLLAVSKVGSKAMKDYWEQISRLYTLEAITKTIEMTNQRAGNGAWNQMTRDNVPDHTRQLAAAMGVNVWTVTSAVAYQTGGGNGLTEDVIGMCLWLKRTVYEIEF
jgi:hypothetical protein